MYNLRPHLRIIIFLLLLLTAGSAISRNITVKGVVRDSVSKAPVPFASILLKGTDRGALTDDNGRYSLVTALPFDSVMVSAMGYADKTVPAIIKGDKVTVNIDLHSTGVMLGEVIARPKKRALFQEKQSCRRVHGAYPPHAGPQ